MTEVAHILIVEDDEAIAEGLALNLRLEGFTSTVITDGLDALRTIRAGGYDLVMLDLTLPNKDGLEVLKDIRAEGLEVPVVVLSAREGEYDKVAALRLGADDYVTKPFALAELMARLAAVLRRSRLHSTENVARVRFGEISVNLVTREVRRASEQVKLTHLEFELLRFFLEHRDQVFTRDELFREVWGNRQGALRTVDNFVAQLRSKLETDPERPAHFITVRGSGYRFAS